MTKWLAHTKTDRDGNVLPEDKWQPLDAHLNGVSDLACEFGLSFGVAPIAKYLGQNHDIGKSCPPFMERLRGAEEMVDHTSAAAHYLRQYAENEGRVLPVCLLSLLSIGHHGGLKSLDEVAKRLRRDDISFDVSCATPLPSEVIECWEENRHRFETGFSLQFFCRMIYSCLVDADGIDTEGFTNDYKKECRAWRKECYKTFENIKMGFHKAYESKFSNADPTIINKLRREVFDYCVKAGHSHGHFYFLNAPTGGNKTRSSLAFSLEYASLNNISRIIYALPYTKIIEQNADVIRECVGKTQVLEHHSDFDYRNEGRFDMGQKLVSSNWDSPIIMTTTEQLFRSLYANGVSRCRKLHNIPNSIIILDEFQSIPADKLYPVMRALKELAYNYGCVILFCSATVPSITRDIIDFGLPKEEVVEIIPDPKKLFDQMKRVKSEWVGTVTIDELAAMVYDRYSKDKQVLCILNKKKAVKDLYKILSKNKDLTVIHLSKKMVSHHIRENISMMYGFLERGESFVCVSTNLVEAGLDIDLVSVCKQKNGIASTHQAGGRCNRHGKRELGTLYIFELEEKEYIDYDPFKNQKAATSNVVCGKESDDWIAYNLIKEYFDEYYGGKKIYELDKLDTVATAGRPIDKLDFREIGSFSLMDKNTYGIVIPYTDEAKKIVEEFRHTETPFKFFGALHEYTISIYPNLFEELQENDKLEEINGIYFIKHPDIWYKKEFGFIA